MSVWHSNPFRGQFMQAMIIFNNMAGEVREKFSCNVADGRQRDDGMKLGHVFCE